MDYKKWKLTRRQLIKAGLISGAGLMLPWRFGPSRAFGVPLGSHLGPLNDPADVTKFGIPVPDALAPSFKYTPMGMRGGNPYYQVGVGPSRQAWGTTSSGRLSTDIYGYGQGGVYTWPGKTFEVQSGRPNQVQWQNNLPVGPPHLLPVDTSLHWCYSLHGYEDRTIEDDGVPVVVHLHGGHTEYLFDGNPEQFFTPNWRVRGPRFRSRTAMYRNDRPAGNLWYHDHALGITRLNVYAGLAGFYFVRDDVDTGTPDNPLDLPAWPYEKAYAIQDRMFEENGQLFYPSIEGDPFWEGFIRDESVPICGEDDPPCIDPNQPTALAEFFGDHMLVNGIAWPVERVEPRQYRLHLLNGTDSRFMGIRFRRVRRRATDLEGAGPPIPFNVIGSDQGLASAASPVTLLISEPGSRYDIVFDFDLNGDGTVPNGRIIMENIGGDAPFGGGLFADLTAEEIEDAVEAGDLFPDRQTDRIMAFDVTETLNTGVPDDFDPANIADDSLYTPYAPNTTPGTTRQVALFEGMDEFGRLQPLLGTAEPATDFKGDPVNWPNEEPYITAGLIGQMEGAIPWHSPTTENPALNSTEDWEIYNATGDAHPIHLHLVHFDVIERQEFEADIADQPVVQHNGELGNGFILSNITPGDPANVGPADGYVENAPKDMVTALPTQREDEPDEGEVYGQMTKIKVTFDKPGRYVWHCHILSHEDHEMMRVLHVGGGA